MIRRVSPWQGRMRQLSDRSRRGSPGFHGVRALWAAWVAVAASLAAVPALAADPPLLPESSIAALAASMRTARPTAPPDRKSVV